MDRVEADLRCRARAAVSPARFIPIAEQSAPDPSIGEMVVRQACEASRELERSGFGEVLISVNVSARAVRRPDPDRVDSRAMCAVRADAGQARP